MKLYKKLSFFLAAVLSASVLSGCGSKGDSDTQTKPETVPQTVPASTETDAESEAAATEVNVLALKGPTAMGMVKMMEDTDSGALTSEDYHFSIVASVMRLHQSLSREKQILRQYRQISPLFFIIIQKAALKCLPLIRSVFCILLKMVIQ